MLRTLLILGRVSNLPTVWTNVLVVSGAWDWRLVWLLIGVSLLYVGGMTLNDAFDAEWDRRHAPERPIPSGAIPERMVWVAGGCELILGASLIFVLSPRSWPWLVALVGGILLYDWIHKKTSWSVLAMGACRTLVYLLAASVIRSWTEPEVDGFFWPLAMGLYVMGITVAARGERTGGPVKWFATALLGAPIAGAWGVGDAPAAILCAFLWALLVFGGRHGMKHRSGFGVSELVSWLIAAISLFDAMVLLDFDSAPHGSIPFWACLACYCLTRLFQRHIPAT